MLTEAVDQTIKEICLEIAKRYVVHFLEIGTDTGFCGVNLSLVGGVSGNYNTNPIQQSASVWDAIRSFFGF